MTLQYSDSPQYKPTVVTLFLQTSQSAGLYFCSCHVSELDDCLLQQQHQWRHGSHQECHRPRRLQSREEPAAVTAATGRLLMVMTDQSSTHGESAISLCATSDTDVCWPALLDELRVLTTRGKTCKSWGIL